VGLAVYVCRALNKHEQAVMLVRAAEIYAGHSVSAPFLRRFMLIHVRLKVAFVDTNCLGRDFACLE
jgi:hypothetical protein